MKSYGKADGSWDDARIGALIKDALRTARKRGIPVAVHQDGRGDVVTSGARAEYSYMYACVAVGHVNEETGERAAVLARGMPYERCAVDQMIPVVRDALVGGIFEFGASGPAQTVRRRVREAAWCAEWLAEMRGEPFIAGMTDRGITVAPISERGRFVEQAACVFNGHEAWSLSDSITSWLPPPGMRRRVRYQNVTVASDLRSMVIEDPVRGIYLAMMRVRNMRDEAAREVWRARDGADPDATTES